MKPEVNRKASQKEEELDLKAKKPFQVKTSIKIGRSVISPQIASGYQGDPLVCTGEPAVIV